MSTGVGEVQTATVAFVKDRLVLFASVARKIYLFGVSLELTGVPYARSVNFNVEQIYLKTQS